MAGKGFDEWKNGAIFGILFGVLVLYASKNISSLSFISSAISSVTGWLTAQTWFPEFLNLSWLDYILTGLVGMIVGIYIDLK